jgi:hypothetical protein
MISLNPLFRTRAQASYSLLPTVMVKISKLPSSGRQATISRSSEQEHSKLSTIIKLSISIATKHQRF